MSLDDASRVSVIIWYIRRAVASWASSAVTVAWVAALRGAAAVALIASSSRWVDATSRREYASVSSWPARAAAQASSTESSMRSPIVVRRSRIGPGLVRPTASLN